MINEAELRRLDLNLLLTFHALMSERSTTAASKRLFIGQSAVSMALKRLREHFEDPLFVRVGQRLEPTARADEIAARLNPALAEIQNLLRTPSVFDPASAKFELRVGMTDDVELPLVRPLVQRLADEAPGVDLTIRRVPLSQVTDLLERGELDMSLSYYPNMPGWVGQQVIAIVPFRILYDPAVKALPSKLSAKDYAALEHVLVTHSGRRHGLIDQGLERMGLKRRIAVAVPSVAHIPPVIRGTRRVTALPAQIADLFEAEQGLASVEPPMRYPPAEMSLVWHRKNEGNPEADWARALVIDEAKRVLKPLAT